MADMSGSEMQHSRLALQARSLFNVLTVLKRRLTKLEREESTTVQDIRHYQEVLTDIDLRWRSDSGFAGELRETEPVLQQNCSKLFNQCYDLLAKLKNTTAEMVPEIRTIFDQLTALKKQLLEMRYNPHVQHDVARIQQQLDEIDSQRIGGIFGGSLQQGNIPKGQAVCSDLLQDCYDLVEENMEDAEELPKETKYIFTNLMGIKKQLVRIKGESCHTMEDLHHWQNMLDAIDSRRVDGIFGGNLADNTIPAGQAACSDLLSQCYELVEQLKQTAGDMGPEMRRIYKSIQKLRGHLMEVLSKPHTIADVKPFQGQIDHIEGQRVEGIFAGDLHEIPEGQAILSTLLNQCYKLIEKCYYSAEDIEETPQPKVKHQYTTAGPKPAVATA
eukprot:TRINITY_DN10312_c0_g1_i1.p1 TRINITY_DN10312_c0_g1~~TRINITY_DN10312_c0_g1_i1.p1  ORF type:complete len:425 (-),score=52.98 TRINITY_DN10312_c0_g1_i1:361-1521(-)